jgi:uncharacterized membrane protein
MCFTVGDRMEDSDETQKRPTPIHQMLGPLPIALWLFSLASDGLYHFGFGGPAWKDIALYTMVAGVGGALVSGIPAYFDEPVLKDRSLAALFRRQLQLNGLIVLMYSLNAVLRLDGDPEDMAPVAASVAGLSFLAVSLWWDNRLTAESHRELEAPERRPFRRAA